jgi:dTDP-4-amino-4,6-dideoxygalactose transaminase
MKVNFLDLKSQYKSIKKEVDQAIQEVLNSCAFTAGPFGKKFEENFAKLHNAKYCVAVNNGTAALHISMMALDLKYGDEVIVPANTFFATPEAVSLVGAVPVFVDCEPKYYNLDPQKIKEAITEKTRAIITVHLYGQPSDLNEIKQIAIENNLILLEDCAQAHVGKYNGVSIGNFGVCGCFSFYPGKNLGAYGEGGAVITNDDQLYKKLTMIRDHGMAQKYHHDIIGHNYRMSGFQSSILNVKLKYIEEWTDKRRTNADLYRKYLSDCEFIDLPYEMDNTKHVYHLFVIRAPNRDGLMKYLADNQIYSGLHYPIPCHMQKAYSDLNYKLGDFPISEKYAGEILSLPMSEQLNEEEIIFVSAKVKEFYNN